eukprot:m.68199 g.68199  ORF g.68199 m.68199 type:complete len:58 (-) comp8239_c0_seq1:75-248(-)
MLSISIHQIPTRSVEDPLKARSANNNSNITNTKQPHTHHHHLSKAPSLSCLPGSHIK